jgi:hypothetical protein
MKPINNLRDQLTNLIYYKKTSKTGNYMQYYPFPPWKNKVPFSPYPAPPNI